MSLIFSVDEIEHQLRVYQQDISPNEARTSLFNLVVITLEKDTDSLTEAVNELMGKRPCRVIIIKTGGMKESSIHVSARCVEDSEKKQVCIQEIIITSGIDGGGKLPSTWGPLLISGLPTFLWWRDQLPVSAQSLLGLYEDHVDRILVDSRYGGHCQDFFHSYKSQPNPLPLADFAWARLHPLMKLTAGIFNPLELRPQLHHLSEIELQGGTSAESLLYLLWISGKMEWLGEFSNSHETWKGKNTHGDTVEFKHSITGELEEDFVIRFKTTSGEDFSITSKQEGYAVCAPGKLPSYTAVFHIPSLGETLIKEVDHYGSDRVFLESIRVL